MSDIVTKEVSITLHYITLHYTTFQCNFPLGKLVDLCTVSLIKDRSLKDSLKTSLLESDMPKTIP